MTVSLQNQQLMEKCRVITKLVKIFGVLPITSASAERSFSVLKREKTWLRTTMLIDRLTWLTLIQIHRHIVIPHDLIVEQFFQRRNKDVEDPITAPDASIELNEFEDQCPAPPYDGQNDDIDIFEI